MKVTEFLKELAGSDGSCRNSLTEREKHEPSSAGLLRAFKSKASNSREPITSEAITSAKARDLLRLLASSHDIFTPSLELQFNQNTTADTAELLNDTTSYLAQLLVREPDAGRIGKPALHTIQEADAEEEGRNDEISPFAAPILALETARSFSQALTQSEIDHKLNKVKSLCRTDLMETLGKDVFFDIFGLHEVCPDMTLTVVSYKVWAGVDNIVHALFVLGLDNLFDTLALDKFLLYVSDIEAQYNDVHYHCAIHAADVTARLTGVLIGSGLSTCLAEDPSLMLACLLSPIIHDVGHPGTNNAYHINIQSPLARAFNDQS
eukprot:scaffold121693_cov48-Prasinocladus_malaysianus.AAC.1